MNSLSHSGGILEIFSAASCSRFHWLSVLNALLILLFLPTGLFTIITVTNAHGGVLDPSTIPKWRTNPLFKILGEINLTFGQNMKVLLHYLPLYLVAWIKSFEGWVSCVKPVLLLMLWTHFGHFCVSCCHFSLEYPVCCQIHISKVT